MKLAIRVKNEFDRVNVIPFFEKHFPNCNSWGFVSNFIQIGHIVFIDNVGDINGYPPITERYIVEYKLTGYTIIDGVPENLELPKSALVELQNEYQNKYQGIFNLLSKEHNLTLLVTEMDEIIREVNKISSREQELEECLRKCHTGYTMLRSILNQYKIGGVDVADETLKEIEQLLKK